MDPIFRGSYPADILECLSADDPTFQVEDFSFFYHSLDSLSINFYIRSFIGAQQPPKMAPNTQGFTDKGWEIYPTLFRLI